MDTIRFQSVAWLSVIILLLVAIAGTTVTVLNGGFEFSIDFQAGLSVQTRISGADSVAVVQEALQDIDDVSVRAAGDGNSQYIIRLRYSEGDIRTFQQESEARIVDALNASFSSVEVLESAYIGPRFSQTLQVQTFVLVTAALVLILVYLWIRFHIHYALASIVALLHDMLMLLLFFGISRLEISSATVAAALTILGYSLNDTIIIFDRVRENTQLIKNQPLRFIIDASITQSLSRTIITSLTTLLAIIPIAIYAQGSIRDFAISLIVGIVVGTYSSIFVASPILLLLSRKKNKIAEKAAAEVREITEETTEGSPQATDNRASVNVEDLKREIGFKKLDIPKKKKRK